MHPASEMVALQHRRAGNRRSGPRTTGGLHIATLPGEQPFFKTWEEQRHGNRTQPASWQHPRCSEASRGAPRPLHYYCLSCIRGARRPWKQSSWHWVYRFNSWSRLQGSPPRDQSSVRWCRHQETDDIRGHTEHKEGDTNTQHNKQTTALHSSSLWRSHTNISMQFGMKLLVSTSRTPPHCEGHSCLPSGPQRWGDDG